MGFRFDDDFLHTNCRTLHITQCMQYKTDEHHLRYLKERLCSQWSVWRIMRFCSRPFVFIPAESELGTSLHDINSVIGEVNAGYLDA